MPFSRKAWSKIIRFFMYVKSFEFCPISELRNKELCIHHKCHFPFYRIWGIKLTLICVSVKILWWLTSRSWLIIFLTRLIRPVENKFCLQLLVNLMFKKIRSNTFMSYNYSKWSVIRLTLEPNHIRGYLALASNQF